MAKTFKSKKYPGWTIEKVSDQDYFMIRDAGIYAIRVTQERDGTWDSEIMTQQRWTSLGDTHYSWDIPRNQFSGPVPVVIAEAERRAKYLESQNLKKTK